MIKCVILEDEPAAWNLLMEYIEKVPFLKCIGIYESGLDVPEKILDQTALLFLDIQLPELSGLDFAQNLKNPPHIIVTSAFEEYALDAFDLAVTDFLLKPFSFERFFKAISRVRVLVSNDKNSDTIYRVYSDKTVYKVKSSDILYIKAEVDYVKLVTKNQEILLLDSLKNWCEKLEAQGFVQSHRSYIVRLGAISKISKYKLGIADIELPVGALYRDKLFELFNKD